MAEGTQLTPTQKFEEKMKERIREAIGDLIPEEMLEATIKTVMHDAFFKTTQKRAHDGYNAPMIDVHPPLYAYIQELLKPMMEKYAAQWFAENSKAIAKLVQETMGDQMLSVVGQAFQRLTQDTFREAANTIANKVVELDRKTGGPGTLSVRQY